MADDGLVAVLEPRSDSDIPLPPERCAVQSSDAMTSAVWAGRGYSVQQDIPEADHYIVTLPRSREYGRGLVAAAAQRCAPHGTVIVDGQKTDGVDTIYKDLRKRMPEVSGVTRDHGRCIWFQPGQTDFSDWELAGPKPGPEGFVTSPGVFSHGRIDAGSALLAEALPTKLPRSVVDLGAGWGYLTRAILSRDGVETVDAVEADARALACARLNITDDRATLHWADATRFRLADRPGAVVMNPPFHEGRKGTPDLGKAFIAAAAAMLPSHGKLWCVANRHLPYEAEIRRLFRDIDEIPGTAAFKIYQASRPLKANRLG